MTLAVAVLSVLGCALVVRLAIAFLRFRRLESSIPGPPAIPIVGNVLSFVGLGKDELSERILELWDGRTELWRISLGFDLVLVVGDPNDIEKLIHSRHSQDKPSSIYRFIDQQADKGLVTASGAVWRAHRKLVQPAFTAGVLDGYQTVFSEESKAFAERVKVGAAQDLTDILRHVVTKSFLRTSLDGVVEKSGVNDEFCSLVVDYFNLFALSVSSRVLKPWLWPASLFELTTVGKSLRKLKDRMHSVLVTVMQGYREKTKGQLEAGDSQEKTNSLITLLLEAAAHKLVTEEHVITELKIFNAAAMDTTATSLGWTLKVLSLRQDIQDQILQEVKEVVGDSEIISAHQIAKLEFLDRVIKETLRMFPSFTVIARKTNDAMELSGKTIPKDSTVVINIFGVHRNPQHWEEPLKFDPDRFLPERSAGRHPYAYIPFSTGPRNCIGKRFAMSFMKTMLATILLKYRVDPVDDGITDPARLPITLEFTCNMPGGVHVTFSPRV